MKGDFSRSTFDPQKHYSGVRMQQGRVQLDADWNENLDILLHRIETETLDVIGQCGVPVHDAAFGVVTDFSKLSADEQAWLNAQGYNTLGNGDFFLTQGRAYVDGILVEVDHTLPFSKQPFVLPPGSVSLGAAGVYQLYLDVWERHMTALEDPAIREVALGGPDTATRMQVIWQAVAASVDQGSTCSSDLSPWTASSKGRLAARTHPADLPEDPCPVPPGAGYKRLENQLYRVEIHKGSGQAGGPTYKWSRDNGSVVVSVAQFNADGAANKIQTTSLGRDDVLGLHENDWVEVLDDATELAGQPGTLVQVVKIDPDNILTLSQSISGYDPNGHPKVRRWDSSGEQAVTVPGSNDGYLPLEGGVEIKFTIDTFRTGDYWLIPARTVPGQYGDIEWPQEGGNPSDLLPFGILHHYCRVAVMTVQNNAGAFTISVEDCRKEFPPLTELPAGGETCCAVTVGINGDYPDLQSALAARTSDAAWWTICILPGAVSSSDTIQVSAAVNLTISGCGVQSRLVAPLGKPLLAFTNSRNIKLEGLRIDASSSTGALLFTDCGALTIANCMVLNFASANNISAVGLSGSAGPLLVVDRGNQVQIHDNELYGLPAVRANGSDIDISDNRILGGGVEVNPPSFDIRIEGNTIVKGQGAGIQLGGGDKSGTDFVALYNPAQEAAPVTMSTMERSSTQTAPGTAETIGTASYSSAPIPKAYNVLAAIRRVTIASNLIGSMTGSGILTETSLAAPSKLGDVEMLVIRDNQIIGCCSTPDLTLSSGSQVGGGIAAIGLFSTQIVDNFIVDNGLGKQAACGIFILDGSDIDIVGNVIAENGILDDPTQTQPPSAYQAGIAIEYVVGNYLGTFAAKESPKTVTGPLLLGFPAARVLSNQVICPAGQALTISTLGSVIVEGNSFTTREVKRQPTGPLDFQIHGACVAVLDLGVPVWLSELGLGLKMMSSGLTNLHLTDFQQADAQAAQYPDGRVIFNNNTVSFTTALEGDVSSLDPLDATWPQRAWDQATFAGLFISLDDLSINGNQFQSTVPLYALEGLQKYQAGGMTLGDLFAYLLKFIQVGSAGSIIRATSNGLSERLYSNSISYASNATAMDITTSNTATHALVTNAPKKAEANNLSLT